MKTSLAALLGLLALHDVEVEGTPLTLFEKNKREKANFNTGSVGVGMAVKVVGDDVVGCKVCPGIVGDGGIGETVVCGADGLGYFFL